MPIEGVVNLEVGKPEAVNFSLFWDAWRVIQEKFAHSDSLNPQEMVYGAIRGMVASLGDDYTVFLDAEEKKKFFEDVSGMFEGVGMEIGVRSRRLKVIAPLDGTPAARAGLRAGDNILKIDGTTTENMTVEKAVSLIRGKKGTKVALTVIRDGWDESKEFVIERAVIQVPSLKWELKEGNIAYLKLSQFSEKAKNDFRRAASEIASSGADRIVLDLRNNPGGFLQVAEDIAGWFLERGQLVVIEEVGPQKERREHKASGNGLLISYPTVVLLNEGSASASEILAGALRDIREIQIIGKKSFGKGSVQELERLQDDSALKVTIANWLTPKGDFITNVGLAPDIEVDMTDEDFEQELDPQLDKALEVVKNL